ncbi:MAG TPA: caspase family protein [Pyrinomonadaceae bacterium]
MLGGLTASSAQKPTRQPSPPQDKRGIGLQPTPTPALNENQIRSTPADSKPEIVLQAGHTGQVNAIIFSADGRWLATGSADSTIKIWDAQSGAELRTLAGHTGGIFDVRISPDARWLVSEGWDRRLKIWDIATGQELKSFQTAWQVRPAISADFRLVAIVDDQGLKISELLTGKELAAPPFSKSAKSVAFSPTGDRIAISTNERKIVIVGTSSGRVVSELPMPGAWASSVAFSADGKRLASGNVISQYRGGGMNEEKIPLGHLDGYVTLWDLESGQTLWAKQGHKDDVDRLTFSPDGRWLMSRERAPNGKTHAWAVASGENVTGKLLNAFEPRGMPITFTADGKLIAFEQAGELQLRDVQTAKPAWRVHDTREIHSLAVSMDGRWLAVGYGNRELGGVKIYERATGKPIRELSAQTRAVNLAAFPTDGRYLALGQMDEPIVSFGTKTTQRLHLWDVSTGIPTRAITWPIEHNISGFSFQGNHFAAVTGRVLNTLNVSAESWRKLTDESEKFGLESLGATPDGRRLIARAGREARIWDIETGKQVGSVRLDYVTQDVALSPDGRWLAALYLGKTPTSNEIRLVDVQSGETQRSIPTPPGMWRVVFSADGRQIASGALGADSGKIMVWDVDTGAVVHTFESPDETPLPISAITFNHDGSRLATVNRVSAIRIWDVRAGRLLHTMRGHTNNLSALMFSPDDKLLLSASYDGTAVIWDVEHGRELAKILCLQKGADWLVTTPDGLFDGSPGSWDSVLWRFGGKTFDVAPVEAFFNEFYYPGLLGEILSGRRPKSPRNIAQIDRRQPRVQLGLPTSVTAAEKPATERQVKLNLAMFEAVPDDSNRSGSGVRDVRLFRNGSLVKAWRGVVKLDGQGRAGLEATVPIVAGENRFTAYAFNHDNIKSSDATLTVTGAESLKRKGIAYILAVGVNQYANSQYNLKYAVADAQDFSSELKRQQGKLNSYERIDIISLNDTEATKANILKSIADLIAKVQPEDAVIIYFAGHGTAQGNRFYLIPHDLGYLGSRTRLGAAGLQTILAHSISDEELERAVEGIDAGHLLMVIDACNSGQALEAEEKRRGPMNSKGLAQLAYEKGMYILTAAQSYQAALEAARLGHGYLTYALVEEGLKTNVSDRAPRDGQVLVREWLDFATARVPEMQLEKIEEQRKMGRQLQQLIKFVESDTGKDRNVQRPRVFYRRETESSPLIVAKP